MCEDDAIIATNDDASLCKRYVSLDFFVRHF